MRTAALIALLAACGCGSRDGGANDGSDRGGDDDDALMIDASDTGGTIDGRSAGADASATGFDASAPAADATPTSPDAAPSLFGITQYSSRSCQSFGGFGAVHRNSPARVLAFLDDQDGVADIATVAEVIIVGSADYTLGDRPVESLGDDGCCQRAGRIEVTYDDFIDAANAGAAPAQGFWGVRVIYRDNGGNSTVAECGGAAGWYLDADPI